VPLGFDAVFDGEGERGGIDSWAAVRPGGALVVYAFGAAIDGDVPPWRIGWWRARLWLWNRWPSARRASFYSLTEMRAAKPSWFRTDLERLFVLLAADMIQPRIADEIGLEGVGDAHRRLENGELTGEIILRP
jgi:NADPH:quinone reductase-like Zn-dependent oxidoreductase